MVEAIIAAIPSFILSVFVFYLQRKQNKKDKEAAHKAEIKKKSELLQLEMVMANNKLSYACAMALKRGHANGEVEEAVEAYEKAKTKYYHFLNEEAVEYLNQ